MRHLLIILISILLLSSFLTSCEKKEETLYRWKTSSGWEWKTIGDKNNNPQYKGEVNREYIIFGDYIIEGLGTYTSPDGRKYVGEWKDGKRNGQGTFTLPDGEKYVGKWKDGKRNGQGTFTFPDGTKYVGGWKGSNPWNGIEYDKNGNITGRFVNGVKQ